MIRYAQPRFADSTVIPDDVRAASERVRSGRSSAQAENRVLRAPHTSDAELIRRAEALRRARERVARYHSGR